MERHRALPVLLLAVGGFLGATLRYLITEALPQSVPVGTLVANVGGAFLLGVIMYDKRLADRLSPETRLLAGTGFCSSLTTYSTFAAETTQLAPLLAALNVVGTYALGFLAIALGQIAARWSA